MRRVLFAGWLLLLSPALVAAAALMTVRALAGTRGTAISVTALTPLLVRAVLHRVGQRSDPEADALLAALPMVSSRGVALLVGSLALASWMSGHPTALFQSPLSSEDAGLMGQMNVRTALFDAAIDRARPDCAQLVVLGAGYDTRAFTHGAGLAVFEVDAPQTQAVKRRSLLAIGAQHPGALVPVDFNETPWLDALTAAGFDPALRTIVLWEGVSYYLPEAVVRQVLRSFAALAPGSVVMFDYFAAHWVAWPVVRMLSGALGEPFLFGLPTDPPARAAVAALLDACGLSLEQHETLGAERPGRRTPAGFVIARVSDQPP